MNVYWQERSATRVPPIRNKCRVVSALVVGSPHMFTALRIHGAGSTRSKRLVLHAAGANPGNGHSVAHHSLPRLVCGSRLPHLSPGHRPCYVVLGGGPKMVIIIICSRHVWSAPLQVAAGSVLGTQNTLWETVRRQTDKTGRRG